MKSLEITIILLFFSSLLKGEEYIVRDIQTSNIIYNYIIRKVLKKENNNKIIISIIGDTAYITYKKRKYKMPFVRKENNSSLFQTERKGHIATMFIDQSSQKHKQEIYFILEKKNGDRKVRVTLTTA